MGEKKDQPRAVSGLISADEGLGRKMGSRKRGAKGRKVWERLGEARF